MPYNWNIYNRKKKPGDRPKRADHEGPHRSVYEKNKKILLKQADICPLCGNPLDKKKKYPDPLSITIDHIIPISKGGHPSDIENMQAVHFMCNRIKSNKMPNGQGKIENPTPINNDLPWTIDWTAYKAKE